MTSFDPILTHFPYPWEYPWSSARFHCGLVNRDPLVRTPSLLSEISDCIAIQVSLLSPRRTPKRKFIRSFNPDRDVLIYFILGLKGNPNRIFLFISFVASSITRNRSGEEGCDAMKPFFIPAGLAAANLLQKFAAPSTSKPALAMM